MKKIFRNTLVSACAFLPVISPAAAQSIDASDVSQSMLAAFTWQIAHLPTERARIDSGGGLRGWVHGAFMTGVMEAYRTTQDTAYLDYAWKSADQCSWLPGPNRSHADDLVCIQSYVDLYLIDKERANIQPSIDVIDELIKKRHNGARLLWWCDSLFMLPASMTRLSKATGDARYAKEMVRLFWESTDFLYDKDEHLFYRDKRFMPHHPEYKTEGFNKRGEPESYRESNSAKMLWLRGNGWVFAGLARILGDLPTDDPDRPRFVELYKEMANRIKDLQQEDGLWRMGLLNPEAYPDGEVSGSGFFTYGLAWGVRNGELDRETYWPIIEKAWHGLRACQIQGGKIGFVQQIAGAPTGLKATDSQEYGTGAYLLAGSEILKLLK